MSKKNYLVVLYCLVIAGSLLALIAALLKDKTAKSICLIFSVTFELAAAIQLLLYWRKPKLFDNKKEMNS